MMLYHRTGLSLLSRQPLSKHMYQYILFFKSPGISVPRYNVFPPTSAICAITVYIMLLYKRCGSHYPIQQPWYTDSTFCFLLLLSVKSFDKVPYSLSPGAGNSYWKIAIADVTDIISSSPSARTVHVWYHLHRGTEIPLPGISYTRGSRLPAPIAQTDVLVNTFCPLNTK